MKKVLVKLNIRGGILSPGDLNNIIETAAVFNCKNIHLGERQNIYFDIPVVGVDQLRQMFSNWSYDYEVNSNSSPNIISSYVAENLFTTFNNWLSEGVYRDVLDSFDYRPSVKINIVDNTQGLVPMFTGNLNFISSTSPNFWYLYVRQRSSQEINCWPELIYSSDISSISKLLEKKMQEEPRLSFSQMVQACQDEKKFITMERENELELPRVRFPYYEGMNKLGDRYWLGVYRRNNDFSLDFLKNLSTICSETQLGLVHITPWKSFLIKGIKEEDRIKWEKLLGKFGINIRHSSIELNWQIKDGDKFGLKLKKFLIKKLDSRDVRTYGLSFAIRTGPMNISSAIILDRKPVINILGLKIFNLYDIRYCEGFNPNKQKYSVFAQKISKKHLTDYLVELCSFYYDQLNSEGNVPTQSFLDETEYQETLMVYQCSHCLSVYEEKYGDLSQGIPPGTLFDNLPSDYVCSLCENPKTDYVKKQLATVIR